MVIFDNSVLSALEDADKLDMLFCVFPNKDLIVPSEVRKEFSVKYDPSRLNNFIIRSYIGTYPSSLSGLTHYSKYGKGEREGLALAIQLNDSFVTDDSLVRKGVRQFNIKITGTVGILTRAYDLSCFEDDQDYLDTVEIIVKSLHLADYLISDLYSKIS